MLSFLVFFPRSQLLRFFPLIVSLRSNFANIDNSVNEEVIVRLKWGQTEYKGRLISVDSYMNIQLSNTEEFIDMKSTGSLGQVLIRYVKVLRSICFGLRGKTGVKQYA